MFSFNVFIDSLLLKSLKLSHNELGPFVSSSLSLLLSRTPSLTHLSLSDCGITGYTLEPHTGFTGTLVGLTELQELVLDQNHIENNISCLADLRLTALSLDSVISTTYTIKVLLQGKTDRPTCVHVHILVHVHVHQRLIINIYGMYLQYNCLVVDCVFTTQY